MIEVSVLKTDCHEDVVFLVAERVYPVGARQVDPADLVHDHVGHAVYRAARGEGGSVGNRLERGGS